MLEHMILADNSQKLDIFYHCDLELDPMTLTLKLDLDILKMHHPAKKEVSRSSSSKVIACTDRQTPRQTQLKTLPSRTHGQ